jgi:hypothetical protein
MGFLDYFGFGPRTSGLLASAETVGIASPFQEGSLNTIVWSDILTPEAMEALPLLRSEAISIPAVSRARNLLIATIGKFPLKALSKDGEVDPQPSFLYRTDTAVTPLERIAWTVDDLIFHGYSLWEVTRGTNDQILTANWVPKPLWKIDNGEMVIRGAIATEGEYLLFNSPFEGLLNIGARTLRGARDIEQAWTGRVRNPIPMTVIRSTDDVWLTEEEIKDLLGQFASARRDYDGALGYLPPNLTMDTHGESDAALFVEGRNAATSDIARMLNIPVAMLDGTIGVDSLTYVTSQGTRSRFYDESLPFWTGPIEARLSMDDVVPRGQRVRFDLADAYAALPSNTGPISED